MARLFRPTYKSIDPKTGARGERRSDKWYADYIDADGKRHRVALSTDKRASQVQLAEIIRTIELQRAGLVEKCADVLKEPIQPSVAEYQQHLESKGRADKHVSETVRHIRNALQNCGWKVLGDLQDGAEALDNYLAARSETGISHRTINADVTSIRSFCRWLMKKMRLTADPTVHVDKLNVEIDRRKRRRPLTDEEAASLFKATLASREEFRGLSGRDRAMLYMLAQRTGLRRGELLSLTPRSFKLDSNPPTVRVEASNSKHRKEDVLPLPSEVADELRQYFHGRNRSKPIWPGNWWEDSAEMFRKDLAAAEIAIVDEEGRVLDFHGQRTTYITGLARADISPAKTQKLARHSDVNLTLKAYTYLDVVDLASAAESLPSLRTGKRSQNSMGTVISSDLALKRVIEAWPKLTAEVRRKIAMVSGVEPAEDPNDPQRLG